MNELTTVTSSLFLYLCSICSSVFQTKLLFWQWWFALERHFLMAKTLHLKIRVSQSEIYVVQEFQECKLRGWGVPSQTNTSLQAPDLTTSSPSLLGQGQTACRDLPPPDKHRQVSVKGTSHVFAQFECHFPSLCLAFFGLPTFKFVSFFLIIKETHLP